MVDFIYLLYHRFCRRHREHMTKSAVSTKNFRQMSRPSSRSAQRYNGNATIHFETATQPAAGMIR